MGNTPPAYALAIMIGAPCIALIIAGCLAYNRYRNPPVLLVRYVDKDGNPIKY